MMKFDDILEQAQKMQEELRRMEEVASKKTVEAAVGGGMVRVVANGKQEILSITFDPEVLKIQDRDMLQDLVRAGVNQALTQAKKLVSEEMGKLSPLGSFLSTLKGS